MAEVDDGLDGERVGTLTGKYLGSFRVGEPYGIRTCTTFRDQIKADVAEAGLKATEVELAVTYEGVYVIEPETGGTLMSCDVKEVSYAWGDAAFDDELVFVTHQSDPTVIELHLVKVTSDLIVTAVDDFTAMLDKGSAGKFPGSVATYPSLYTGTVSVDKPDGNATVKGANKRIKALGNEPREVLLVVCEEEIKVVDRKSGDEIKQFPVMDVSYTALDSKDSKKFSFITSEAQFELMYCHSFAIEDGKAKQVPVTINNAFKVITEKLKSATPEQRRQMQGAKVQGGSSGALGVFDLKYIGSVATKGKRGDDVVVAALEKARAIGTTPEMVVVIITPDGVRTIEGLTGQVKQSVFIEHVSFTACLGEKKEIFGFISVDTRLRRVLCHLYDCGAHKAQEVTNKIGEAFTLLKEKGAARKKNPFASVFTERDTVPGQLFRCQVHRSDVVPDKVIGAGQFGQVYLAMYKGTTKVAVKTVRLAASENDKDDFVQEAEVMRKLEHENLVKLVGVAVQQRPWLCVIEYVQYGDLADVLQTCKEKGFELSFWEQHKLSIQVARGLGFMAMKRYLHMDLAARNCLLGENNFVKIADFGLTTRLDRGKRTYALKKTAKLPVRWIAIESIETGVFSELSDVWAFGVLIWEILMYGELPFKDVGNADVQKHVIGGNRLVCPKGTEAEIALGAVAHSCWLTPKKLRPNFFKLNEELDALEPAAKAASVPERDIGVACQVE